MGNVMGKRGPVALLAAAAAFGGAVPPARADLTTDQRIRILEGKVLMQDLMAEAGRILDGTADAKARASAHRALFWLTVWFETAEGALDE